MGIFVNSELRRITVIIVSLAVLFLGGSIIVVNSEINELKNEMIGRDSAVIGAILDYAPELQDRVLPFFTKGVAPEVAQKGRTVAQRYGYTGDIPTTAIPVISRFRGSILNRFTAFAGGLFVLLLGVVIFEYRRIFKRVARASELAESMVKENEFSLLPEEGEGGLTLLNHNLNEVSLRLKESIAQLERDKRFLKDVVADISHQLKTPLSSLIMLNELLLNENVDVAYRAEFLEKSRDELERMEWLIMTLLKIARMEVGAIEFDMVYAPLKDTLERAAEPLRRIMDECRYNFEISLNASRISLKHDVNWLAEAITNILKNAVEHTPNGGNIAIDVTETLVITYIIIRDNGEGIAPGHLPNIFKNFYSTNRVKSSVGIGLPLAKSIVEKHGGTITVSSVPGEGSEFKLAFLKA